MAKLQVSKSIDIDASPEKVYQIVSNFHNWRPWSPWLIAEEEAELNIREDGKYYEWEGKLTGSGNMTVLSENAPNRIKYDLTFLKPWKSTAKTDFVIQGEGDHSTVTWNMDSSLPFFMFWMQKTMTNLIGMDYDRGLKMLKEYAEKDTVTCKLEYFKDSFPGKQYVGIRTTTPMRKMGEAMSKDLEKLGAFFQDKEDVVDGELISIYHKWDMKKQEATYTSAMPVKSIPSDLPTGFTSGSIPAAKTFNVKHTGPYEYLGNAWASMMMRQRSKEFKVLKGFHPFETYLNSPHEVDPDQLETVITFGVKEE